MKKPELDYLGITEKISSKCNLLLSNLDSNTVSDTFDAVREIVEIAIENYSFNITDYWRFINKDADVRCKIKFTDTATGYESLMRKWVELHPFKAILPKYLASVFENDEEHLARLKKKGFWLAGGGIVTIGTIYAICALQAKGFLSLGILLVAIVIEIIGIALIYSVVKHKKKDKREEIDKCRCLLIETLIDSAELWLKNAVSYSDNIIARF